jgi:hypothetical protein
MGTLIYLLPTLRKIPEVLLLTNGGHIYVISEGDRTVKVFAEDQ